MMEKLVSVIVPIYNTEKYLERCIGSICSQTYQSLEIILIDDGSTDASLQICRDWAVKDSRIKLFSQKNAGASAARNYGLDCTIGNYVVFVDSDDYIDTDMIEEFYKAMESSQASVVISDVSHDRKVYHEDAIIDSYRALKIILSGIWWGGPAKMFNKDVVGTLRFPNKTIAEDYVFMVQLMDKCKNVYYLSRNFYHVEQRCNSLSHLRLSDRKFDELYNVKYVSDYIASRHPELKHLADHNLAGTLLKLLGLVYKAKREKEYATRVEEMVQIVRMNYGSFLRNPYLLFKQKVLLTLCLTKCTAKVIF